MYTFEVKSTKRSEMIDITNEVQRLASSGNVDNGLVFIYTPHTTAGLTINEGADPNVKHDIINTLNRLVPCDDPEYRHGEGNSDAHIKTSLIGSSVTVLMKQKKLMLGTWQSIFLYEADGPRSRKVHVEIIPI
jgi:secondary thiamine-phosphate synthase enzyme